MEYSEEVTAAYFDSQAATYSADSYAKGGPNAVRLEIVKKILAGAPKGRVLDAGCGAGDLLVYLTRQGYAVAGSDISPGMVEIAKRRLAEVGAENVPVETTSLAELSAFPNESFDIVTCLGVLPYVPIDREPACYREIARLLKPGGIFIAAFQNELFDLFTFNRYTVRFFRDNVFPLLRETANPVDEERLEQGLKSLMTHPDRPTVTDERKSSQRGHVFTRPENPLTLPDKMRRYGLVVDDTCYYHFHAAPPLVLDRIPSLKEVGGGLEVSHARHWLGMFMASTFLTVATRAGRS